MSPTLTTLVSCALLAAPGADHLALTTSAIVNGAPAEVADAPGVAAIVYGGGVVGCTGVLIRPDLVLTARHCADQGPVTAVALDTPSVRDPGEIISVLSTWRSTDDDIALLSLATPAHSEVASIGDDDDVRVGQPLRLAGYGAIDDAGTQWSAEFRTGEGVVNATHCSDASLGCRNPSEWIMGGVADTCRGDSGGPVYAVDATGGPPRLVAMTLRGLSNSPTTCGGGGIVLPMSAIGAVLDAEGLGDVLPPPSGAVLADTTQAGAPGACAFGTGPRGSGLPWIVPFLLTVGALWRSRTRWARRTG